ncbi:TPA: glutamate 5-kinase [Corynebacterium striatum]|nr:glutamate 5-kinase [Corynebacterium striatum]HAT1242632.1 glutamate 5-kinase [Corynebacterium striatum]HAT1253377.1 glutamate 5-kinase [Corynebacterium striatum]HAT1266138.1 glutamate 5-kinase [Corynebacterium striatum]HAT1318090.1 glutamate 5-kinase [Corynebacterium striatum]
MSSQQDFPLTQKPYSGPTVDTPFPDPLHENPTASGFDSPLRQRIAHAKRVVIKIGSSSLTDEDFLVSQERIDHIVDAVHARMGISDVILVSSGAVAAGMGPLGLNRRPTDLATKQAAASVGQVHLAYEWGRSFARYDRTVGQVLLTASDTGHRDRARNAQRTIDRLRQLRTIPIVNENDTVATSEMHFGDNDRLSALVANLMGADALFLFSDVDGLYDKNPAEPDARFIDEVRTGKDLKGVEAGESGNVGTGGMATKVSAARLATRGGIPVLLTSTDNIGPALADASVGTVFHTREERKLSAWKFWALYCADAGGAVRLDAGAMQAVTKGGNSLLAVGITEVIGEFSRGEIIDIMGPEGEVIGRGEVRFDSAELRGILGKQMEELPEYQRRSVVHADYLSNYASRI